jgi:radical SAM protein with 4Fe4S-binding SPASM domain
MNKSRDSLMSNTIYGVILRGLKDIDYKGAIHLYLMGEPLEDPNIRSRIREAREMFPDNVIFISTNGDGIKDCKDLQSLVDCGLTWMGVSHYDNSNERLRYKHVPGVSHTDLDMLSRHFFNRGGNIKVPSIDKKSVCDWVMEKAYINYRGDVILCCSDYHYEVVFGNVLERPFIEIYNCPEYQHYRTMHLANSGKELPLCKRCNRIQRRSANDYDEETFLSCDVLL